MRSIIGKLRKHELAMRVLLVPVFVGLCYCFQWMWLRGFTTETLVRISAVLGVSMHRLTLDVVSVGGIRARFETACTMIDAFFGAIPLLWSLKSSIARNVARLAALLPAMFLLNVVRLEFGFVALSKGAPWWLAHECVSGLTYFLVYLYIVHEMKRDAATHREPSPDSLAVPAFES